MTAASPEIDDRDSAPAPPWAIDDPGMARAVGWYEANRHREDLPMLLRVMELELAARRVGPPTKPEPVPPRTAAGGIPDLLTLVEAAALIGMSPYWLRTHRRQLPDGVVIQGAKGSLLGFRRDGLRKWRDDGRILAAVPRKERR